MSQYSAMDTLRKNIRLMLTTRGWTQTRLAEETGIKLPNINRILNQDVNISMETAEKLADAFGLSLAEMLSENLEKFLPVPA